MFSSGMPLMMWIAFFSLIFQYWCYKYLFLRYNKRPPQYDHTLNEEVMGLLIYALMLHIVITIYMLSNPMIFPLSVEELTSQVNKNLSTSGV